MRWCFPVVSVCFLLSVSAAELPTFRGASSGVLRAITLPTVDISGQVKRHSFVARGTKEIYQGHCDTVLLPDGKTMFAAWCLGHAQWIGPIARSGDGGLSWSKPLPVPENWNETSNTPTLHRLVGVDGRSRLFCFADGLDWSRGGEPPYPMHQAVSEDGGMSWSPMSPNGVQGEVPPKTIHRFDDGARLVMWSDLPGFVVQAESGDGGLTWSDAVKILRVPSRWSQPCVVRSPDGKRCLMLLRENSRRFQSLFSLSEDDARTWSEPRELPAALTGDRHVAKFGLDGRLVVAMRDRAKTSLTYGHYVAWIGHFEDLLHGGEGQCRIKLLHNAARGEDTPPGTGNADCGYSDLERLADGTFVATTYIKYGQGPEKNSVVCTRFKLSEIDLALQAKSSRATPGCAID
ncbi:MAG: sialidase family protein [Pirellulaceae bacterium]|nr:sialidase family protein [Pirellulaceae bacterium]